MNDLIGGKQPFIPSCGYQAPDMVDDDIDDTIGEFSVLINYPSAEGLFTGIKSSAFHREQKKAVANATANRYETNGIRDSQFVTSTSSLTMRISWTS